MTGQLGLEAVILRGQVGEPLRPLRLEVTEAASLRQQTPDLAPPGLGHPDTHLAKNFLTVFHCLCFSLHTHPLPELLGGDPAPPGQQLLPPLPGPRVPGLQVLVVQLQPLLRKLLLVLNTPGVLLLHSSCNINVYICSLHCSLHTEYDLLLDRILPELLVIPWSALKL